MGIFNFKHGKNSSMKKIIRDIEILEEELKKATPNEVAYITKKLFDLKNKL